jgi:uncharacterized membrane protein (DUF2068 family)
LKSLQPSERTAPRHSSKLLALFGASRTTGLRLVALFEAGKGLLVLVVGLELLRLIHQRVQNVGEAIVARFHLNFARHHPRILLYAATHLNDSNVRLLVFAALAYSTARFIEAYGLWRVRAWAEWFAILSGGIYLPLEVYEVLREPTFIKAGVLLVNAVIVAYLIYVRWNERCSGLQ